MDEKALLALSIGSEREGGQKSKGKIRLHSGKVGVKRGKFPRNGNRATGQGERRRKNKPKKGKTC